MLEGLALEMRRIIDAMADAVPIRQISLVCGGATRSPLTQALADFTGRELLVCQMREATAMGAALLAWVGVGQFADPREAVRVSGGAIIDRVQVCLPAPLREASYARYLRLVAIVREATRPKTGKREA